MRIGIFSESYPPLINGVSTSVQTLIAELERAGHTTFVFTSRYPRYVDDRPGVYRFPSVNSLVEPNYVLPIPLSARIARIIPTLKLDIIHAQSPFLLGILARRVARHFNLPLVSTNHTLYTEYAHYMPLLPASATRGLLTSWMRHYYNDCDAVIAPSEMTRRRLADEYGVRAPVSVVPTGIPAPPYVLATPVQTKREMGVSPDSALLLYVGRLAPEKNLELLLEAFARIAASNQQAALVIAGSGPSERSLRVRAQRLGVDGRVIFAGFLRRTQLDPLYRAADVFLFPSKTETQGLAIGEALAAGTPCVVVNAGGAPESVEDGKDGFLVADDSKEMADATLRLLGDAPLHQRMAARARVNAAEKTPERMAARIIALYERLIAGRGKAGCPPSPLGTPVTDNGGAGASCSPIIGG